MGPASRSSFMSWAVRWGQGASGLEATPPHAGHCLPLQRPTFKEGVSIAYSWADWQQGATVRFRLGQGRRSTLHFLGSWHLMWVHTMPLGKGKGWGEGSWHRRLEAQSPRESFQPSCHWEAVPSVHAGLVQRAHAPWSSCPLTLPPPGPGLPPEFTAATKALGAQALLGFTHLIPSMTQRT